MTKLNQIIAIEKSVKAKAARVIGDAGRELGKAPLLSGISRTYQPKDEDGEQLPPESTKVQRRVEEQLREVSAAMTRLFDVTATKDRTNAIAAADVVIDGEVLLADVPVTYLLFLEKQVGELQAFVKALPVLDAAESWTFNDAADCYATDPVKTQRAKKVPRNHVKAEATEEHPAQVDVYYEDIPVGYWTTVKFSGAAPAKRVAQLAERLEKLQIAVKFAREEANGTEVVDEKIGDKVFGYLLGE
ncbi:hypothetical protein K3N28_19010 [Glycomyces sp. TRM65418]|uniref:DUF7873 family protein n=1 Tax=Glycomyces sp. TRM65418 TaxID=2867006 RepID=UPI001CE6CBBF|nr:hypothetical protein [Glycomyces sp. TRM65418]MCC3765153.1 hypothetical protein [Glycomyces sp. TRM65418]QZD54780.1 hypothetical protein K3N28_18915 [Glycomyces sp. TRM65418]